MSSVSIARESIAPVTKSVEVGVPPAQAFETFTAGMIRWWNRQYSINSAPIADIILEPKVGGRWLERGDDGSECQWGKVLAWEPPSRLLLAWQIEVGEPWRFNPDLVTELEIRFIASGAAKTRVELEHRHLERLGDRAVMAHGIFDSPHGWQGLLAGYAKVTTGSPG